MANFCQFFAGLSEDFANRSLFVFFKKLDKNLFFLVKTNVNKHSF